MSDETTLLLCPFCGGNASLYEEIPGGYIVQCHDCCGQIGIMAKERAIAAWNTRAELGSGTCELEPLSALDVTLNMLDSIEWGACSECGCAVPMDAKFCNECGKAVK